MSPPYFSQRPKILANSSDKRPRYRSALHVPSKATRGSALSTTLAHLSPAPPPRPQPPQQSPRLRLSRVADQRTQARLRPHATAESRPQDDFISVDQWGAASPRLPQCRVYGARASPGLQSPSLFRRCDFDPGLAVIGAGRVTFEVFAF